MPGKIIPIHHSVVDWDFELGAVGRELDNAFFVSAPTSLKITSAAGSTSNAILCRIPTTLVLPQGEVRTWMRRGVRAFRPAIFRNQAASGSSNFLNTYGITFGTTTADFWRYVAGGYSLRDSTTCYTAVNTWLHYRVFWYNGFTPGEAEAICVDLYREVAGEWVKMGNTLYDTQNSWKDSEINRCGILATAHPSFPMWIDDTEIWGPV